MKKFKEFYFILAAFIAGIIAKIVFLGKGDKKEAKKTIKNIINRLKSGKEKLHKLDKETKAIIEDIKNEEGQEKRLNKIADLFKD